MYELPILAKQTGMDQHATDAHTDTHTHLAADGREGLGAPGMPRTSQGHPATARL